MNLAIACFDDLVLSLRNQKRKVILGVAESDSHVVANYIIAIYLRQQGFHVINLGPCTPVDEFIAAYKEHNDAEAIIIGSLNGHAYQDLKGLKKAISKRQIQCPVIIGGNLSVGSHKSNDVIEKLYELGIDYILEDFKEIVPILNHIQDAEKLAAN